MSMYLQQVYPASAGICSRPYLGKGSAATPADQFQTGLLRLGQAVLEQGVGGQPLLVLDERNGMDWHNLKPDVVQPILAFSDPDNRAYKDFCAAQPWEKRTAIRCIVSALTCNVLLHAGEGTRTAHILDGYDARNLKKAFLTLWNVDPWLDPRLVYGEELIAAQTGLQGMPRVPNLDRHRANLETMGQPNFANRLGLTFLFSRLAPHFGVHDPDTVTFVERLYGRAQPNAAICTELGADPEGTYKRLVGEDRGMDTYINRLGGMLGARTKAPIVNRAALVRSTSQLAQDVHAIRHGDWARLQKRRLPEASPALVLAAR